MIRFQSRASRLEFIAVLLIFEFVVGCSCRANGTQIHRFRIIQQTPDGAVFDVDYFYTGDHGNDVAMSAVTAREGRPAPYWGFRPAPVTSGDHRTRVEIGLNSDAPRLHETDRVIFGLYDAHGTTFYEKTFSFKKTWTSSDPNAKEGEPIAAPPSRLMNTDGRCVQLANEVLGGAIREYAETIDRLVRCLPGEAFHDERGAARAAFVRIGEPAIPALVHNLENDDFNFSDGAAQTLAAMGPAARSAVPALESIVRRKRSGSLRLPSYAAQALGKIGEIDFLIRALEGKEGAGAEFLGAQGLGAAGANAARAVPSLIDVLNGPDPVGHMYAAEALGKIGPAAGAAVPRLAVLSRSSLNFVRRAAGEALISIGTPQAREAAGPYQRRQRRVQLFFAAMSVFVWQPWLAAVVGMAFGGWAFAGLVIRPERKAFHSFLLVPAFFWCGYSAWEYAQRRQANIRIDLLLIDPFLAGLTALAVGVWCASLFSERRRSK